MQEAHEERGVEAHRAGGIEQDHEPQRLDLAPAPDEIDRRAAMGDAAMDGAAQVEPPAAPAHLLAAHQPRPHRTGEPRGERMGRARPRRDRRCGAGRSRRGSPPWRRLRAVPRPSAVRVAVWPSRARHDRASLRGIVRRSGLGDAARRGSCSARDAPLSVLHRCACRARPEGLEDLVERSQSECGRRRTARAAPACSDARSQRRRRGEDRERIARLGETDARSRCRATCARSRRAAGACSMRRFRGRLRRGMAIITPPCRAAARSPRG